MLLQELIDRVSVAVNSEAIGKEICNRLQIKAPKTKEEARQVLKTLRPDLNSEIEKRLKTALGNYDHGECGIELAEKINGVIDILQAMANGLSIETPKDKMGSELMSKVTLEALILSLNGINAAKDFEKQYDLMVETFSKIQQPNAHTGSSFDDFLIKEGVENEVQAGAVKKTQETVRKRIRLKKR
jgi:hypothetical protein